jgi:hypothetical protein
MLWEQMYSEWLSRTLKAGIDFFGRPINTPHSDLYIRLAQRYHHTLLHVKCLPLKRFRPKDTDSDLKKVGRSIYLQVHKALLSRRQTWISSPLKGFSTEDRGNMFLRKFVSTRKSTRRYYPENQHWHLHCWKGSALKAEEECSSKS